MTTRAERAERQGTGGERDTAAQKTGGRAAALGLAYAIIGAACYLIFLAVFLYLVGFVSGWLAPRTLDTGPMAPTWLAVVVDVALIGLFGAQHSVMARAGFKRWWARVVPPALERSVYVLISSLSLILLYWLWLPLAGEVWTITNPIGRYVMLALAGAGWLVVLLSSFLIDHAELFGLRQVYAQLRAKAYATGGFKTPGLYRLARHPMMSGFLLAFWATPRLTVGHLLFALAMTGYILLGVHLEERDLIARFGALYVRYQRQVGMFAPRARRSNAGGAR